GRHRSGWAARRGGGVRPRPRRRARRIRHARLRNRHVRRDSRGAHRRRGPSACRPRGRARRPSGDPGQGGGMGHRGRRRCDHHHRRHRAHRARRHARSAGAAVRQEAGRLFRDLPPRQLLLNRAVHPTEPGHRRHRRRGVRVLPARLQRRGARWMGPSNRPPARQPPPALQPRRAHAAAAGAV
ncbi:MAG: Molybdenum cofactor biosynthesis protein MoaB, partial [uncultured Sphingomonadaceae bacterium]